MSMNATRRVNLVASTLLLASMAGSVTTLYAIDRTPRAPVFSPVIRF